MSKFILFAACSIIVGFVLLSYNVQYTEAKGQGGKPTPTLTPTPTSSPVIELTPTITPDPCAYSPCTE